MIHPCKMGASVDFFQEARKVTREQWGQRKMRYSNNSKWCKCTHIYKWSGNFAAMEVSS